MEKTTTKIDPKISKNPESAVEYNEMYDFIHDEKNKFVDIGEGKKLNLLEMRHLVVKKTSHLPKERQEEILTQEEELKKKCRKMAILKREALGMAGVQRINNNSGSITEQAKSQILEWFGRLYSDEEVRRKLAEAGLPVSLQTVIKFKQKYKVEIEKLQHEYEMDWRSVGITRKRSRLDQLSYIYNTVKQDFDKTKDIKKLNYSREMRAVLEQVKKEVEGDVIKLDINGNINMTATIEVNKTVEELYSSINFMALLIGRVAARFQINPTVLHHRLMTSWYSEFTGVKRNDKFKELTPNYPSSIVYNWDSIREKHESKKEMYERLEKTDIIEDAQIISESKEKKKTMKEIIIEKLNSAEKLKKI